MIPCPMDTSQTLYWYDLETFGVLPYHDRIAQFAGIRTNYRFEPVDDPLVLYIRIPEDYLPDPLACLVTGITPQKTLESGISEYEAVQRILREFSRPGTCVVGYNNISFDDEFIRNAFYRNFLDPYRREYANGNSRWDIIDLMRAAHDLRPEGMQWVTNEKGHPSFKLGDLSAANQVEHLDAHDALSDVRATIGLAQLVYEKQKDLFLYAFGIRKKQRLKNKIHLPSMRPLLYTSSVFTSPDGCTAVIAPLTADPNNPNSLICFNLSMDPEALIAAVPSRLKEEVPLVRVSVNKCPFLAPLSTLDDASQKRLRIDKELCLKHHKRLLARHDIPAKVRSAFSETSFEKVDDPDFQLYSGGFFSDSDWKRFEALHAMEPRDMLGSLQGMQFEDRRVPEMLWRLVCRNFPDVLTPAQKQRWTRHAASRLLFPPGNVMVDLNFYKRKIREKASSPETPARDKLIMKELEEYGAQLERKFLTEA